MRDELIKLLQDRVGLDRSKAEQAVDVVMNYLKDLSPDQIKSMLQGRSLGGLEDLFGR